MSTQPLSVFVTGGNAGIGLALCKQLAVDHGCRVFMGSRSLERGEKALEEVKAFIKAKNGTGTVQLVQCDTSSDSSVQAASEQVKKILGTEQLYGVVNNAGTGLQHKGVTDLDIMNVNLAGPRRVCDAFLPLLQNDGARIVNVGSGAGPSYVRSLEAGELKKKMCRFPSEGGLSLDDVQNLGSESQAPALYSSGKGMGSYGLSKALLSCYTMALQESNEMVKQKNVIVSCITPGFIDTAIVSGWGATKSPEEGTVSIRHCLFHEKVDNDKLGKGWFYGSDTVRSPLHFMRNPGEPAYDGKVPE